MMGKRITLWTLASLLALLLVVWTSPVMSTAKGEDKATQQCESPDANGECAASAASSKASASEAEASATTETSTKEATTKPAVRIVTEEELAT